MQLFFNALSMGYLWLTDRKQAKNRFMRFETGKSGNPNGRPPGKKTRNKQPLHQRVETLVLKNFDQIEKDIEVVAPEVRLEMIVNLAGLVNLNKQTA
jgi:hypothetical protein